MSLTRLKSELAEMGVEIDIVYVEEKNAHQISITKDSPAQVMDGKIYVLSDLSNEERIQAEAHELGHLYVKELGIINFEPIYNEPIGYLKLELNNTLSHKFIIQILEEKFGISSDIHLQLRIRGIDSTKNYLIDSDMDTEVLYGLGLNLYDIAITAPNSKNDVLEVLSLNESIKRAYQAAETHLGSIHLGMSKEEQEQVVNEFLSELGITIDYLIN